MLCHRCERQTSVIRVFSTVTMALGEKCDVTIVQWGTSLSEYIRRATWRKVWRATWRIWRATWRTWRATWRSQKATWQCAMLEMARWNTLSVVFKVGMLAIGQNIIISVLLGSVGAGRSPRRQMRRYLPCGERFVMSSATVAKTKTKCLRNTYEASAVFAVKIARNTTALP